MPLNQWKRFLSHGQQLEVSCEMSLPVSFRLSKKSLSSPFSLIVSIFNVVLCIAEIKNKTFQYFYRYAWWKCPWFSKSSQIKICYPSRGLATHFCLVSPFQILGVYGLKSYEWKIDLLADEKWFLREYFYNPSWLYKQGNIFMSSVYQWYCWMLCSIGNAISFTKRYSLWIHCNSTDVKVPGSRDSSIVCFSGRLCKQNRWTNDRKSSQITDNHSTALFKCSSKQIVWVRLR